MSQPGFTWDADVSLPVSGLTPEARHSGATGAQIAARSRADLSLKYIALLKAAGPLSDPEAASALGVGLSSICSTRNGVAGRSEPKRVVPSGAYEVTAWGSKRVRWAWRTDRA